MPHLRLRNPGCFKAFAEKGDSASGNDAAAGLVLLALHRGSALCAPPDPGASPQENSHLVGRDPDMMRGVV